MTIQLITPKQHETLLNIYKSFPALTLENKGYEGINRSKFTEAEAEADKQVNEILKKAICGFSKFQNFRTNNKENNLTIRFQYDYTAHDRSEGIPFIGVGYIKLNELLSGFNNINQ
jgi:hypothetical protein